MPSLIHTDLPTEVFSALVDALGLRVLRPGPDEWELVGPHDVRYVGSWPAACAFLTGYAAAQMQTMQILNDIDNAHRGLILGARERMGSR